MQRDQNEERRAVKQAFARYRRNQLLLSNAPTSAAEEAQLALEWTGTGDWMAVDDLVVQRAEAERYNKKIKECVTHYLSPQEHKIITQSYMIAQRLLPWQIYEPLHIERTPYYTAKAKAIAKLYVAFRMQKLLRKSTD